jgi:hypothetical protein
MALTKDHMRNIITPKEQMPRTAPSIDNIHHNDHYKGDSPAGIMPAISHAHLPPAG